MNENRRASFATLYESTLAPLRRYLGRLLRDRDEAHDVAHDAYARVYRALDSDKIRSPEALLYTTARRLALNHLKRRERAPIAPVAGDNLIPFTPAAQPGVEQLVMARQEGEALEQAIRSLPAGCRHVLLLAKIDELTHAEIAQRLEISVSTVEKQHARALRLLRATLTRESHPEEACGSAAAR